MFDTVLGFWFGGRKRCGGWLWLQQSPHDAVSSIFRQQEHRCPEGRVGYPWGFPSTAIALSICFMLLVRIKVNKITFRNRTCMSKWHETNSFIHSFRPFLLHPFKSSTTQRRSRLQHGYCIGVSRQSAQATAGKGFAQGPYVATRAGVEPTTLRLKVIVSTKAPPRPTSQMDRGCCSIIIGLCALSNWSKFHVNMALAGVWNYRDLNICIKSLDHSRT